MNLAENDCIFERELALLVALQGESIWKGASAAAGWGDIHWKDATSWWAEVRKDLQLVVRVKIILSLFVTIL